MWKKGGKEENRVKKEIDKIIKDVWLEDICEDYGNGLLIKEASLQCALCLQCGRKRSVLCSVLGYMDFDDADNGNHAVIKGKILSGLGFHQNGECPLFLLHIIHDRCGTPADNRRVADSVLAGDFALERDK